MVSKNAIIVLLIVAILLSATATYIAITTFKEVRIQSLGYGEAKTGAFLEPIQKSPEQQKSVTD